MIKNVIFDLGGVVVNFSPKRYLEERFSNMKTEQFLYNTIFDSVLWGELDRGTEEREVTEQNMLKIAKENGRLFEAQAVLDEWQDMLEPRLDTIKLIKKLKENGYKVYYLSNIAQDIFKLISEKNGFSELFDGGIASYEVNLLKPEPEIYTLMLEKYSLVAKETVFCDDTRKNITAARALDIRAVHFLSAAQFEKELKSINVNINEPVKKEMSLS